MSAAGQSSRSIAVELALLFLRELEPWSQKIRSAWSRPRRYSPLQLSGAGILSPGNTGAGFSRNTKNRI